MHVTLMPDGFGIIWSLIVLASVSLMIWALVDLWKSKAEQNTKILWTLLVVMVNPIGSIVWFTVGKKANK